MTQLMHELHHSFQLACSMHIWLNGKSWARYQCRSLSPQSAKRCATFKGGGATSAEPFSS